MGMIVLNDNFSIGYKTFAKNKLLNTSEVKAEFTDFNVWVFM